MMSRYDCTVPLSSLAWNIYFIILYVQEVVTLQKKYLIFLHQKMRFYIIYQLLQYFRLNVIRLQSKIILGHMNWMG